MTKIAIIYYSTYGHVAKLAEALKKGVEKVPGATATIYQIPETLSDEVLAKMHAPPKKDYPVVTREVLTESDGLLFGFPSRFGSFPGQVKQFFDSTTPLWSRGLLTGKPAGLFFCTGTQGGGQETVAYTSLTFLTHHGMTYVPLGYRSKNIFDMERVHGGSPWGVGTIAGPDNSTEPLDMELEMADVQGQSFAEIAKKLAA